MIAARLLHRPWAAALAGLSITLAAAATDPPPPPPPPPAADPAPPPAQPERTPAQPAGEREVTLHLHDGRRFTGVLIEQTATEYILRIAGIRTPFKTSQVDRCETLPSVLERFRTLRATVEDTDAEQLLRLIDWLASRGELDTALAELDALLKRVPEDTAAVRARQRLLKQLDLRTRARTRPIDGVDPATPPEPAPVPPRDEPSRAPVPLLSAEDIAVMKVYEIDMNRPPRVEVPRETITALIETYGAHPTIPSSREGREGLYRLSSREQLELLFKVRARDLYRQVKVLDQPDAMRRFRDDVARAWLIPQCATTNCHGGTEAGRLVLATRNPASDATNYTNFLILQSFRLSDGRPLLSMDDPERSPLLQIALPRDASLTRHPPVGRAGPGRDLWKPAFLARDDRRFADAVEWIKALYRPRPDYGITYSPLRPFEPPPAPVADPADPGR